MHRGSGLIEAREQSGSVIILPVIRIERQGDSPSEPNVILAARQTPQALMNWRRPTLCIALAIAAPAATSRRAISDGRSHRCSKD